MNIAKVIIPIFILCIAASCKKNSTSYTPAEITGTWNVTQEYQDTNRNGGMDADELVTDTAVSKYIWNFNGNGRLTVTYYGAVLEDYNWSIVNNTWLRVTDTGAGTEAYSYLIQSLNSTGLELKDTAGAAYGGTTWTYFTKQ